MRLRIREARDAKGLVQRDVAKKIGLSQPYYAQIERGERRLSTETQIKIAKALGVKPADLVDFDAPDESEELIILKVFRSLSPERRQGWIDIARAISKEFETSL
ncbi:DNA-binding transcriptional regulator, XRE-family HTH domain [Roseovarius pacificus]|uniref:DNA-binding transcriptional regulator, XRE-family HTH domain n=1 Tax=Roseovarius pacificus TaxID=337701 RepID=A0A1M6X806_9RHOB|nr:helix-turn-helix transcriptional regulator [Roseovarius pacificus]GGO52467.1 hypothetical protein GCM10011315_08060 [Roseovarius pacificus]SHL01915.1 DNA-binding transcriptional regulator, XRE-family HTH domain [Roseovarius pacificus]